MTEAEEKINAMLDAGGLESFSVWLSYDVSENPWTAVVVSRGYESNLIGEGRTRKEAIADVVERIIANNWDT